MRVTIKEVKTGTGTIVIGIAETKSFARPTGNEQGSEKACSFFQRHIKETM
ncbi:MAG: hypothetical protein WCK89_07705 [bacterium]